MDYGNFEYRVVYDKQNGYSIMQLFEKDGIYYFISKLSSTPYGNSEASLKANLQLFMDALEKPILLFDEISEIYKLLPK